MKKAIKGLIITLIVIVALAGVTIIGGYIYVRSTYGIDLFHTLDAVLKIGSAESLNMQIGTTAVNALIGDAENIGFAYSMQALGKTAFEFAFINEQDWFVIY